MHQNTIDFGDIEEVKDVRLIAGEDGRHYLHAIFALPAALKLDEKLEERLRLHLTDGVQHTYTEIAVIIDQIRAMYHKIDVENAPTVLMPAVQKKRQFKAASEAPADVAEGDK